MRTTTRSVTCALILLALSVIAGSEPSHADHPELGVMKHFAPILWLAVDEPLVPTLPHPFAFDGIAPDLEDPAAISWDFDIPLETAVNRVSHYQDDQDLQPRVLYYPPTLVREVDPPPYNYVYVLEYWFYYLYDRGVGGHKGDSEHAFVFVAINHRLDEQDPQWDDLIKGKVVGVVGAGHARHTANNVLVTGRNQNPKEDIMPSELTQHIGILVERGKHASAPDRDFNSRFDIGADANIFRDGAWGSRDVRTNSMGRLFGKFKSWYSFPRKQSGILVEQSAFIDSGASIVSTDGGSVEPDYYDGYSESFPHLFPKDGAPLLQESENKYTLFPMTDLATLYAILEDKSRSDQDSAHEVSAFLQSHQDCFWLRDAPDPVSIDPGEALRQMRRWPDPKEFLYGEAQHVKLLEHSDHKRPDNIFKLHLYPVFAPGLRYKMDGQSGGLAEFTTRFSDIDEKILRNSMLEVNASWDLSNGKFYDVNVHYFFFRGSYSGIYAGAVARKERLVATGQMTAEELGTILREVGAEPPLVDASSRWRYGLDFGWAITYNPRRFFFVDFNAGIRGDVFHAGPTDFEIARGARDKFRFVWGVAFRWGIGRPKHPLSF